ncbi:uncharacterized protein V1510DRAFT_412522 [Dipodascopsis tothii]|uniref:uncharacterized protein n=1 Tax=Dipodascopsis tothii TaxID=44089 RepID=UPI0034CE4001
MKLTSYLAALSLAGLASAHFTLNYPTSRGSDHDTQTTGPCGGLSTSSSRTAVDADGFPVAITSSHTSGGFAVYFCPKSSCTTASDFNITLLDTILEEGAGNFCMPEISIPESVLSSNGTMNGTVQVMMISDDGNLYNCADVSLSRISGASSSSQCTNGTGVTATSWTESTSTATASSASTSATETSAAQRLVPALALVAGAVGLAMA